MVETEARLITIAEKMESFADIFKEYQFERLHPVLLFGMLTTLTQKYTEQGCDEIERRAEFFYDSKHQHWDCY